MSLISQPPSQSSLVEQDEARPDRRDPFYMAKAWLIWLFESLIPRVQASVQILLTADQSRIENQAASIATTALDLANLPAGTYRVTYYARKTTIDGGGASALTITLGWTENGGAQILSGPAMATDTTTSPQSGSIMVTIDNASALTFATVVGAGSGLMRYKVEFTVEAVSL